MGFKQVEASWQIHDDRQCMSEPKHCFEDKAVVLLKAMPAALNNLLASRAVETRERKAN